MAELKQTKGFANFKGIIGGLDKIKDGTADEKLYKEDEKIKKMKFTIKTSDDNMHFLELIQFKMGKAMEYAYISRKNEETGKFEWQKIAWEKRNEPMTDGWRIIGIDVKAVGDEKRKSMVAYDAIDYIKDNFNDGDSVFIGAEISHSEGNDQLYTNFSVKKMFATKDPIDFESEDFEEISEFDETVVFKTSYPDENGLAVLAYSIDYKGDTSQVQFLVKNEDKEVADYIEKELNLGDSVKVAGIINNRAEYEYVDVGDEEEQEEENIIGRKTNSQKRQKRQERHIKSQERNLQITSLDVGSIEKGLYKEEDLEFVVDNSEIPF